MSPRPYVGPLLVTAGYVVLYYLLFANVLRVRLRLKREYRARGEQFDRYFHTDRQMLAADRYAGNMLEHMPPFLALLWMGERLGRGVPNRILFATVVGYAVIAYFVVRLFVLVATVA